MSEKIQKSPGNAQLLSTVAIVDALLGKKQDAIAEAERASSMVPISRKAWGIRIAMNVAVVYAWTGELDHSFEILKKLPYGIHYGELKASPFWDPLRKDPRFDRFLAKLAPKD